MASAPVEGVAEPRLALVGAVDDVIRRHLTQAAVRLYRRRWFPYAYISALLLAGLILVAVEAPWANNTDEDDYMPYALGDLVAGKNPYTTVHSEDQTIVGVFGNQERVRWETAYPYLPMLIPLQIPLVDYRVTALLAYGAMLWRVRDRPLAFFGLGNPLVLPLAASGFNDVVVVALMAWGVVARNSWANAAAAAAKQFALPVLLLDAAVRRNPRVALWSLAGFVGLCLPFFLWSPDAFVTNTVTQHFTGGSAKPPGLLEGQHANYYLYPLFVVVVLVPEWWSASMSKPRRAKAERVRDGTQPDEESRSAAASESTSSGTSMSKQGSSAANDRPAASNVR